MKKLAKKILKKVKKNYLKKTLPNIILNSLFEKKSVRVLNSIKLMLSSQDGKKHLRYKNIEPNEVPFREPTLQIGGGIERLINMKGNETILQARKNSKFFNNQVVITEYLHKGKIAGNGTGIIYLPHSGKEEPLTSVICKYLFGCGYNVFHIHKPITLSNKKFEIKMLEELPKIIDRYSQVLDYMQNNINTIDPQKLGLFGLSLGAVFGSSLILKERERLNANILMMGGAPFYSALKESSQNRVQKEFGNLSNEERHILEKILTGSNLDPSNSDFSNLLDRNKTLQIIAQKDTSVPTKYQYSLNKSLNSPSTIISPFGHVTTGYLLPTILDSVNGFYYKKLIERTI